MSFKTARVWYLPVVFIKWWPKQIQWCPTLSLQNNFLSRDTIWVFKKNYFTELWQIVSSVCMFINDFKSNHCLGTFSRSVQFFKENGTLLFFFFLNSNCQFIEFATSLWLNEILRWKKGQLCWLRLWNVEVYDFLHRCWLYVFHFGKAVMLLSSFMKLVCEVDTFYKNRSLQSSQE